MGRKKGILGYGLALFGLAMVSHGALVAEWTFDEGSGTSVSNSVDGSYGGTLQGTTSWVTGHDGTGYALDFAGVDGNFVAIPATNMLASVSNQISITFWAYGNTNMPQNTVGFQGQVGTGGRELQCHMPWADLSRIYWDAAGRYYFGHGAADYLQGDWVYWVFTKNADEGTMKVYANGLLRGESPATYTTPINGAGITRFAIGANNSGASAYAGAFDEFKIYDHELSYQEIAIGYNPNVVVAQIDQDVSIGQAPLEVVFDGSASFAGQGIADYLWDFGEDPSNMVISASGPIVTNTFTAEGDVTVTLYVVDTQNVTNSATTLIKVLGASDASEEIGLVAIEDTSNVLTSAAYYDSSILYLLTDPFGYHPNEPTAFTPQLAHTDGFHGNEADGSDVWLSFSNSVPYTTTTSTPVVVMDVWGRNYASAKNRDDDFDVQLFNGSWDAADIVGYVEGCGVDDSSNYTRAIINTLPIGTTFDRVRIVGHNSSGGSNNPFTLTEVRLAAIAGEVVTVVAKLSADPLSGYYPLEVSFDASESYAVEGSITNYFWDFGDGTTSSGAASLLHTYNSAGLFTNTLSVVNSIGETNSTEIVINALNPITVDIASSVASAYIGVDIGFDGSGSTNEVADALTSYLWDFGDGSTAGDVLATNSYAAAGTKTVTLTVGDAAGRSNSATAEIIILPLPTIDYVDGHIVWSTPDVKVYDVLHCEDLVNGSWVVYTNVTATPPTTSVELPLGSLDQEFFRVGGFE
ncbi:PKD domain-containing protein [Pontiella sp.]|uniref:PKD domain-containing protein n=1 Tax=Pontiella sp. TaxID=2837462 RepID=UPI0035678798